MAHHLVTVPTAGRDVELLGFELWETGAVGVEETGAGLRAAFTDLASAIAARDRFAPDAEIETLPDTIGVEASRDLLAVERAGRFAIHPPWLAPPAGAVGIEIDPGLAFGSGSHASTRLALELLDRIVRSGDRVADVGCGTGVLSVGAALLGASVTAVDTDPHAVAATADNARRNDVAEAIEVRLGSAADVPAASLVVMNMTIDVHEAIAAALPEPVGIIVAGILADQLDRAAVAHRSTVVEIVRDGDWVAAILEPDRVGRPDRSSDETA